MSKSNKQQVPKVRFTEFSGDWDKKKLKELVSFSKGKSYSKSSLVDEGNPIILYGSLYTDYKSNINNVTTFAIPLENSIYSEGDEILLPSSGESDVDIARASAVTQKGVLLGGDLNVLKPKKDLNNIFMALNLTYSSVNSSLVKRAQGQVVVHLYNSDIQNLKISFPSLEEQTQISNFYQEVDKLIELQTRAVESAETYKQSMLQKMFPQKGEKVPRVRFAGFSGDWEEKKVGDVSDSYSGGTPSVDNRNYYNNGNIPFIRSGEISKDKTELFITELGLENSSAKLVDKGDILYALYGATSGEVARSQIKGAINQAILAIFPHEKYDPEYLTQTLSFHKELILSVFLQGGQGNLSGTIIKSLKLLFPSYEEQTAIGNFFQKLDQQIEQQAQKLATYQQLKKAMLQRMFV